MELDPSKFALSASFSLLNQLQGAYHATEYYNLQTIMAEGVDRQGSYGSTWLIWKTAQLLGSIATLGFEEQSNAQQMWSRSEHTDGKHCTFQLSTSSEQEAK